MKRSDRLVFVFALVLTAAAVLWAADPSADPSAEPALAPAAGEAPPMSHYVVALVRKGPSWRPADTDAVRRLEEEHLANIFRLRSSGQMLQSGPFTDPDHDLKGLFVFDVKSVDEARELIATDPAIRAGHFEAELLPWMSPSPIGCR